MNLEIYGMMGAGVVALVAGLPLVRARFRAASGADRALVLGPVFEAVALAVFAAEHFLAARDLKPSCRDGCRAPCSGPTSLARRCSLPLPASPHGDMCAGRHRCSACCS